ncbi:mucin-3B-like [Psammomys obesus]|uniref:mucin-3B-like n=1 Tax=Psammomys obesus TaxID=48139 RepID=UPI0024536EB8|nr:mucin-3B-like [Psammomys obesus]
MMMMMMMVMMMMMMMMLMMMLMMMMMMMMLMMMEDTWGTVNLNLPELHSVDGAAGGEDGKGAWRPVWAELPPRTAASFGPSPAVTCLNGGVWTGQSCQCPNGFTGPLCEERVPVVRCQNGGSWDGLKCQCPSLFYGPRCEDVVDAIEIAQTVSAAVDVSVTVTSLNFSEELTSTSTGAFKRFNETFSRQMAQVYRGVPEYRGVRIRQLR